MNKQIFILAMAALGFVACSSDETVAVNQNDSDAINIRPLITGMTRAADASFGTGTSFKVTAFPTGTTTGAYFSNVVYTATEGTTFTSTNKYYWPAEDGKLDWRTWIFPWHTPLAIHSHT